MQDQLRSLPPRIPAATLSGSLSASDTASILDDVARKRIKILFVSPERLTSPSFRRLFYPKWNTDTQQQERTFPEISILCVDEAHCVSQWAHNFRPCFLRFKGLLQLMKPQSILAVTATAGDRVIQDICHTLGIPSKCHGPNTSTDSEDSILIVDKPRDNINVNCQFVESDDERLNLVSAALKTQSYFLYSFKDSHIHFSSQRFSNPSHPRNLPKCTPLLGFWQKDLSLFTYGGSEIPKLLQKHFSLLVSRVASSSIMEVWMLLPEAKLKAR